MTFSASSNFLKAKAAPVARAASPPIATLRPVENFEVRA